uniref:Uncharacterized protein n=1 Tax=Rhipicephalus zambeziensis TaxID=60191 RepID=A0A224Y6N7_9ACAR
MLAEVSCVATSIHTCTRFPLVYHCETLWCTPPDWEIDRVLPTGGACRGAVWECLLRRELQLRLVACCAVVRASVSGRRPSFGLFHSPLASQ